MNINNPNPINAWLNLDHLGSNKYEILYFSNELQVPRIETKKSWISYIIFKISHSRNVASKTLKFCEENIDALTPSNAKKLIDKITPRATNAELTRIARLLPKILGRLSIEQEQAVLAEAEKNAQAEANANPKFSTERHAHIASHLSEVQVQKGMVTVHLPKGEIKFSQLALAEIPYFAEKLNKNQGDQIVLDIRVEPQILEAAVALHNTPSSLVDMEPKVIFEVFAFMEKIDDIAFIKTMHKYLPHEAFSSEYLWSKLAAGEDWVVSILMNKPDFILEDLYARDVWHPDLSTARKQVENVICSNSLNPRNIDTITTLAKIFDIRRIDKIELEETPTLAQLEALFKQIPYIKNLSFAEIPFTFKPEVFKHLKQVDIFKVFKYQAPSYAELSFYNRLPWEQFGGNLKYLKIHELHLGFSENYNYDYFDQFFKLDIKILNLKNNLTNRRALHLPVIIRSKQIELESFVVFDRIYEVDSMNRKWEKIVFKKCQIHSLEANNCNEIEFIDSA